MVLYYLAIVLFLILGIFMLGKKNHKYNQTYLLTCFAIMLILHSFVNPDYCDNYYYGIGYKEISKMSFIDVLKYNASEVGFRVLCKLLAYVSTEWVFGLFAISVIMLSGYYLPTKRYSSSYLFSVLLILVDPFLQSTFVLRQHLAIAIILFSYLYVIEKKLIPYLLTCFIAFLIHQTALIFFPVYFLYHLSRNKFAIVSVIAFFILSTYMSYFLMMAGQLSMNTAGYGAYYFEQDSEAGTNNKMALLMVLLLVIRIVVIKEKFFDEGITRLMSIVMVLGTIFSITGIGFIGTSRLNMYFTSVSFLFIPNTFYYLKSKSLRGLSCFSYFLLMLYLVVKNASSFDGIWFITPNL